MSPDSLSIALRSLALITLFQATGAVLFMSLFAPLLRAAWKPVRQLAQMTAGCALLFALAHHALEAARMAGDYGGLWDGSLQRLAWGSRSVVPTSMLAAGLLMMSVALWRQPAGHAQAQLPRTVPPFADVGAVIALCALLQGGHTSVHPEHFLLSILLALHLLVVAFWYGALWPLILATRVETAAVAARLLARYSLTAGYLVPFIAVLGVLIGRILTGTWPDAWIAAHGPYGQLLLLKLLLFALLMLPAAYNKWRLVPALQAVAAAPATTPGTAAALRRSIVLEMLLIAMVLTVTATLTTLYSPQEHETTQATAATMTAPA